jgi:CheY-like chemotaxis protein
VETVSDGAAAWAAIERSTPPRVLLDWQMPVMDGLEVCRRLRANPRTANTFVLMVTGRDQPEAPDLRGLFFSPPPFVS